MAQSQFRQGIPTRLTLEQFEEFVLPHLHMATVYTQVDSEPVSTPKRWIQTGGVREQG